MESASKEMWNLNLNGGSIKYDKNISKISKKIISGKLLLEYYVIIFKVEG